MTEDDARAWIADQFGDAAVDRLATLVRLVVTENERQNLIAPSTIDSIWLRHVLDSVQLLRWDQGGTWVDIGTGGGFPGVAVALLRADPVVMIEPRSRRAAFLRDCVAALELSAAKVVASKVERWSGHAAVISARAVASMTDLFRSAYHCSGERSRWLLPKGRSAEDDLAEARTYWRGTFHVEQSRSDPDARMIVVEGLRRR